MVPHMPIFLTLIDVVYPVKKIKPNFLKIQRFRRVITQNLFFKISGAGSAASEERYFVTYFVCNTLLSHCATCQGSSHIKNEYNFFYHKLDAEYLLFDKFFEKSSIF